MNKTDVVSALIVKNNKILAVKRALTTRYFPGMLSFPGGKREKGETLKQAVKREVLEETGYLIRQIDDEIFIGKAVRDGVKARFYAMKCEIVGMEKVTKDANTVRKVWVNPKTLLDSLVKYNFYPELIVATNKYFKKEGLL